MHRRRGTRDEDEAHLEVAAYEALGLRSALRERCVSILTPSSLRCSK